MYFVPRGILLRYNWPVQHHWGMCCRPVLFIISFRLFVMRRRLVLVCFVDQLFQLFGRQFSRDYGINFLLHVSRWVVLCRIGPLGNNWVLSCWNIFGRLLDGLFVMSRGNIFERSVIFKL